MPVYQSDQLSEPPLTTLPEKKSNPNIIDEAFVQELVPAPRVVDTFDALRSQPGCLLLDSAMQIETSVGKPLGRYSFLMADPFERVIKQVGEANPLEKIRESLKTYRCETIPDLPPMQGGWAGLLSYDLSRSFENIPPTKFDPFNVPAIALGCYDVVIAWDHEQGRAWIISQGMPETDSDARTARATRRATQFMDWLESPDVSSNASTCSNDSFAAAPDIEPLAPQFDRSARRLDQQLQPRSVHRRGPAFDRLHPRGRRFPNQPRTTITPSSQLQLRRAVPSAASMQSCSIQRLL